MTDDTDYLVNYKSNHLYTYPAKAGAFATIVADNEVVLGEIDVTNRSKIAITAFYVKDKSNFSSFKIKKIVFNKRQGWHLENAVEVNHFDIARMRDFVEIISSLDLRDAKRARLSLDNIDIGALTSLIGSSKGADIIRSLAEAPDLHRDIYAIANKRAALEEFRTKLEAETCESEWQKYFESNPWIFGHGLNYIALEKVSEKLEVTTTGSAFDQSGKRTDALVRTRAEISQYVFVEVKRHNTDLLSRTGPYRPGCWSVSTEMAGAVTQVQKTVFQFTRNHFRDRLKDELGADTGQEVYAIEPRSYLVIGNTKQLQGNDDKVSCFELYRRNIRSPEILTFDELYYRARYIVENISKVGVEAIS